MSRPRRYLLLLACFVLPCVFARLVYQFTEYHSIHRLGYWLWLSASTEDMINMIRVGMIHKVGLGLVVPLLAGLAGLGWGRRWLRRPAPPQ